MKVGILGGGQLASMLALAGFPLGAHCVFLDPNPHSPAFMLGDHVCEEFTPEAIARLAQNVDVLTYEFENVPGDALKFLEEKNLFPPVEALRISQDRLQEKRFFESLGIPTALFAQPHDVASVQRVFESWGISEGFVKTRRLGYDGKGQIRVHSSRFNQHELEKFLSRGCIVEGKVSFLRELSQISTRTREGKIVHFPLTENVHRDGILHASFSPPRAPVKPEVAAHAQQFTAQILQKLNYVGTFALELFETASGLVVNECAPRVHNSGHWTIEGTTYSQFEAHMRAILGLPLPSPEQRGYSCMVNILGTLPHSYDFLESPDAHLHLYHKDPRPGRKLGHITYVTPHSDERERFAQSLSLS
jgi:5-(carboxyamino)imidazole ribonucleotide synthase